VSSSVTVGPSLPGSESDLHSPSSCPQTNKPDDVQKNADRYFLRLVPEDFALLLLIRGNLSRTFLEAVQSLGRSKLSNSGEDSYFREVVQILKAADSVKKVRKGTLLLAIRWGNRNDLLLAARSDSAYSEILGKHVEPGRHRWFSKLIPSGKGV
jgi:hypothetical protein